MARFRGITLSLTGFQPALFRTVLAFDTFSDHIGSALDFELYLPNLLDLRLDGATHLDRPSVIPALVARYFVSTRRRSLDRVIATLTHWSAFAGLSGFSTARFQSRLLTRPDPSSSYRLCLCETQRLVKTPDSILEGRR